ncbi:hypothetical protein [Vibrio phage MJW]
MVDKIQTKVIDADSTPVKGSISNSDYVMIQNDSTKELEKVLVSDLLAGSAGSIRIKGEAQMDNPATTPTSIVITGDPDDTTITQGNPPTDLSPNGVAYVVVTTNPSGVSTQITGEAKTVFDNDQIVWTGSKWSVSEFGSRVTSVNGRTGDVSGLAEAADVYTKGQSDAKYYSADNKPKFQDLADYVFWLAPNAGRIRVGGNTDLVAGRDDKGFLPRQEGTGAASVSYVGNPTWWFGESWINSYRGGSVNVTGQIQGVGVFDGGTQVYSANNKPTPTELGVLPSSYVPDWSQITNIPEFATRWPTKAEVGLSNVNNWLASSAINSDSTTTYATAAGVKTAYDAAQAARSAPDLAADRKRKITISKDAPTGGVDGDIWLQYV